LAADNVKIVNGQGRIRAMTGGGQLLLCWQQLSASFA